MRLGRIMIGQGVTMTQSNIDHEGLRLFTELLDIPSPSGFEHRTSAWIAEKAASWGFEPTTDDAGNVLVQVTGEVEDGPLVCLAAHTDELAMVVTQVESDGALRVTRSGGLFPWKVGERAVEILGEDETVLGATSMGSGHSKADVQRETTWEKVRVLTGLAPGELARRGIGVGTPIVPARQCRGPIAFGNPADPMIGAWTFDNRLGVVTLLQLLERISAEGIRPKVQFLISFTVQEEIGCHGAKILAQRVRPDVFVAVDGSPLVPECPVPLDGSPGIRTKDRVATYDPALVRDFCRLSASAGVDLHRVVYDGAASDASLVYSIGAAPRAACLGYVRASSHGFEVAPLSTFDKLLTAVKAFFSHWDGNT